LRIITYNIRKGKGATGNRVHAVGNVARALSDHASDLVLCQEVFHPSGDGQSQTDSLARALGMSCYYGGNKKRRVGHHGNATFTSMVVDHVENFDLTIGKVERRGALYTRVCAPFLLHVVNVHLSLSHQRRLAQIYRLGRILRQVVPESEPVLLAGDFNDWGRLLHRTIVDELGFVDAFADVPVLTWHAKRPVLSLDRVYVRHLEVADARRLSGVPWSNLSDHLPLEVEAHIANTAASQVH